MPDALKDHEGISEIIWCKPFCPTIIKTTTTTTPPKSQSPIKRGASWASTLTRHKGCQIPPLQLTHSPCEGAMYLGPSWVAWSTAFLLCSVTQPPVTSDSFTSDYWGKSNTDSTCTILINQNQKSVFKFIEKYYFYLVCACVLVNQLYPTLCDPKDCKLLCPWDSLVKNTRMISHSLLQENFLTQGSNSGILHWQAVFTIWATREVLLLSCIKIIFSSILYLY